jgi:diaminopimelate decarboxylase
MNLIIRPMLYNSFHKIMNLTKIDNENKVTYTVVGPICESSDIFVIKTCGAYGQVMASKYNKRDNYDIIYLT